MDSWAALLVMGGLALVAYAFVHRRPEPPRDVGAVEHEFDPGPPIADGLNVDRQFAYRRSDGREMQRRVLIRTVYGPAPDRPTYVRGLCRDSGASRTFAVRRMSAFIDPLTGEGGDPSAYIRVMISRATGQPLVCSDRERFDLVAAGSPVAECETTDGQRFSVAVTGVRIGYGRLGFRGRAKRHRASGVRAWSGDKTFYPDMLASWRSGEDSGGPGDLKPWLERFAGLSIDLPPPSDSSIPIDVNQQTYDDLSRTTRFARRNPKPAD